MRVEAGAEEMPEMRQEFKVLRRAVADLQKAAGITPASRESEKAA